MPDSCRLFSSAALIRHEVRRTGRAVPLVIGLERESGLVSRFETLVSPEADAATLQYVERIVKFLLWSRGGWKLIIGGPQGHRRISSAKPTRRPARASSTAR